MNLRVAAPGLFVASLLSAFSFAACSSSSTNVTDPSTNDGGGGGTDSGTDAAKTPTVDKFGVTSATACPKTKYGTLVVVGDSISDVGGGSNPEELPFYRTLLLNNDDAKYPEWKGFDLATCAGLTADKVVKVSKGGAVATIPANNDPSDMKILVNQTKTIPNNLAGPVLVVGTIGGNDVTAGLKSFLFGSEAEQQANLDKFLAGVDAALTELTKADRFGAGVKADVFITNIYDPSGGTGNFYYAPESRKCEGALGLWPDDKPTEPALAKWNTAMKAEVGKYTGAKLLEMYTPFQPHAVSKPPAENWFYKDCIHPSSAGQHAVRSIFWHALETL